MSPLGLPYAGPGPYELLYYNSIPLNNGESNGKENGNEMETGII